MDVINLIYSAMLRTNRIFVVTISDAIFYSVIFYQCINSLCENDFSFQFRVEINANKVFKKL